MAKFTSLEFMEALGLGYFDYNGAKILLRLLASKGIAKPVGKIRPSGGKGRSMVVYEMPEEITLNVTPPATMPSHPPKKKKKKEEESVDTQESTEQIPETVCSVPENTSEKTYEWDDGWDDE